MEDYTRLSIRYISNEEDGYVAHFLMPNPEGVGAPFIKREIPLSQITDDLPKLVEEVLKERSSEKIERSKEENFRALTKIISQLPNNLPRISQNMQTK